MAGQQRLGPTCFTFVFGALFLNLWEEAAWQGLVQRHLTRHHGAFKAALLTAVPFALLHLPLAFIDAATPKEALPAAALIVAFAPALRYLIGWLDLDTGGSLLAVGVLHASFNATGSLDVLVGGWQHMAGLAIVAAGVLLLDRARRGGSPRLRSAGPSRAEASELVAHGHQLG